MRNIKEINIKNSTYYFFDDIIKIQDFNANLIKIEKESYKHININYIGYVTKKDSKYVNIHIADPLYFIFDKVDGFIEEKDGNFASTNNNKEVLKKYAELWNGFKNLIEKIDNKPGE